MLTRRSLFGAVAALLGALGLKRKEQPIDAAEWWARNGAGSNAAMRGEPSGELTATERHIWRDISGNERHFRTHDQRLWYMSRVGDIADWSELPR